MLSPIVMNSDIPTKPRRSIFRTLSKKPNRPKSKMIQKAGKMLTKRFSKAFVHLPTNPTSVPVTVDEDDLEIYANQRLRFVVHNGDSEGIASEPCLEPEHDSLELFDAHLETIDLDIYATTSTQGRREYMEDVHCYYRQPLQFDQNDLFVFGVFDGHGGANCSSFCADEVNDHVVRDLEGVLMAIYEDDGYEEAALDEVLTSNLKDTLVRMDREYCAMAEESGEEIHEDGTTATVLEVFVDKEKHVAHCHLAAVGDSRAILSRHSLKEGHDKDTLEVLSVDHDPSNPEEVLRVEGSGGKVVYNKDLDEYRVQGAFGDSLAVTRSVGDVYFKALSAEADVKHWTCAYTNDDAALDDIQVACLASDGVWGWLSNEEIHGLITRRIQAGKECTCPSVDEYDVIANVICCQCTAKEIIKLAFERGSNDNVACTVVNLSFLVKQSMASSRPVSAVLPVIDEEDEEDEESPQK